MNEEIKIWEKLPHETSTQFEAFRVFLEMNPMAEGEERRTLKNCAKKLGKALVTMETYSQKNSWRERAQAYDNYIARHALVVRAVDLTQYRDRMVQRTSAQITLLDEIIERKMRTIKDRLENGEDVPAQEIGRLVTSLKDKDLVYRRLVGLPTEYKTEYAPDQKLEGETFIIGEASS